MSLVLAAGSGPGTSLGLVGQNFVPISDIGSVQSSRLEIRTYDAVSDFTALADNSRLRGVRTFLSSYAESTQNYGSRGYLSDLSDFRVPSYGSVSDFRLETEQNPMGFDRTFTPEVRNRTIRRQTEVRRVSIITFRPQILRRLRI